MTTKQIIQQMNKDYKGNSMNWDYQHTVPQSQKPLLTESEMRAMGISEENIRKEMGNR